MTVWQEAVMSLDRGRSRQSDLEGLLEASHAEVAHMQQQIAATTAAIASSRGSSFSQVHYSAPGDPDYSEDPLIRSAVMRSRCQPCAASTAYTVSGSTLNTRQLASAPSHSSDGCEADTHLLHRQLTDEMNLELEERRKDFEMRSKQLEDQARFERT